MLFARFLGVAALATSLMSPSVLAQGTQPPTPPRPGTPGAAMAESHPAPERKPAELKLINPGQEPRRPLRYKPAVGDKQAVSIRTRAAGSQSFGTFRTEGTRSPAQVFRFETEVKNVTPEGDVEYLFGITEGTSIDERGLDPLTVKGMQEMAESIVGVTGSVTVSSTGRTKHTAVVLPPKSMRGPTQFIAWTLQSVRNALEQTWALLPDEAVGVGAKWEVVSYTDANPNYALVRQVTNYEISAIDGERIQMSVTLSESGDPQVIKNQAAQKTEMTLLSHGAQGKGTSTIDLTRLMPMLAVMNTESNTEVEIKLSATHQEHHMRTMHLENSVETIRE